MIDIFSVGLAETGCLKVLMNEEVINEFYTNPKDFEKEIEDNKIIEAGIQEVFNLLRKGDKAIKDE